MQKTKVRQKYVAALEPLLGRSLVPGDGLKVSQIASAERRLELKLPLAMKAYYQVAGRLPVNVEHNRLYPPQRLRIEDGKLVFMEENQRVAYWALDISRRHGSDPVVYQTTNQRKLLWYSERLVFSNFILKMWRWQRSVGNV
jgi:hypothetical protein